MKKKEKEWLRRLLAGFPEVVEDARSIVSLLDSFNRFVGSMTNLIEITARKRLNLWNPDKSCALFWQEGVWTAKVSMQEAVADTLLDLITSEVDVDWVEHFVAQAEADEFVDSHPPHHAITPRGVTQ